MLSFRPLGVLAIVCLGGLVGTAACTIEHITTNATPPAADAGTDPDADTGDDGSADAAPDTSDPVDPNYPAGHTPIPIVDWNGGTVVTSPKIVTVTFGAETFRSRLETFGDTITTTKWWDAIRAGYCSPQGSATCVGQGGSGGHVNITTPPETTYTDSAQGGASSLQAFLTTNIQNGILPTPTKDMIYVLYFPAGVSISLDNASSCQQFGGYHNTLVFGGQAVPYAVIPRCDPTEKTLTIAASHEIAEASTDPDVGTNSVAYYMMNQIWAFAGGEVGDVCVDFTGSGSDTVVESTYTVQRSWSNIAAKAGHDPCVPSPAGQAYFKAAPAQNQQQVGLAVGKSVVLDVTAFSDAPMAADWDLSAVDLGQFTTGRSSLSFSFDKTKVHNGSKVQLTVTLTNTPNGPALYAIVSRSGRTTNLWYGAVLRQ